MEKSMNIPEPEQMDRRRLESINIINALRRGTVPASGLERIAVGLDVEEGVIGKQLDYVSQGVATPNSSGASTGAARP